MVLAAVLVLRVHACLHLCVHACGGERGAVAPRLVLQDGAQDIPEPCAHATGRKPGVSPFSALAGCSSLNAQVVTE